MPGIHFFMDEEEVRQLPRRAITSDDATIDYESGTIETIDVDDHQTTLYLDSGFYLSFTDDEIEAIIKEYTK